MGKATDNTTNNAADEATDNTTDDITDERIVMELESRDKVLQGRIEVSCM